MQIAEAYQPFVFGHIRFAHFAAAQMLAIAFVGRIRWPLFGNHHARQLLHFPFWHGAYWKGVLFEIRRYLFPTGEPKKYVGHHPLAQLAMFFVITLGVAWMIVTGFAHSSEGAQDGSLIDRLFVWLHGLIWNCQNVHRLHHPGMWRIAIFTIIHSYVPMREDSMSRQSNLSTMISGHGTLKDDRAGRSGPVRFMAVPVLRRRDSPVLDKEQGRHGANHHRLGRRDRCGLCHHGAGRTFPRRSRHA